MCGFGDFVNRVFVRAGDPLNHTKTWITLASVAYFMGARNIKSVGKDSPGHQIGDQAKGQGENHGNRCLSFSSPRRVTINEDTRINSYRQGQNHR